MSNANLARRQSVLISPPIFDVALWFPLLFLAVSVPMLALRRNVTSGDITGEVSVVYGAVVYAVMGLLSILLFRHRFALRGLFTPSDLPLILFFLFIVLQAIAFQSTMIALQAGVFACGIVAIRAACFSARFRKGLFLTSVALILFIGFSYLTLGPPVGRWLGGIHPNVFGAVCVGAFSLSLFGPHWWRDVTLVVVLAVSVSLSSRYTMVTSVMIYAIFSMLNWRAVGQVRITIIALIVLIALLGMVIDPNSSPVASALELNDRSRGLGSGISGRDKNWMNFLPQFFEQPLAGYGFRNRQAYISPHNGFMEIILQVGLVGSVLFFGFYLNRLRNLAVEVINSPRSMERGKLLSILIGVSFGAMLQPQLFSFGDPFGIVAMVCLFCINGLESSGALSFSKGQKVADTSREGHRNTHLQNTHLQNAHS